MTFDFLSSEARRAIVAAQKLARGRDEQEVQLEHLLTALLATPATAEIIRRAGVSPDALRPPLEDALAALPKVRGANVYLAAEVLRLLDMAQVDARERGEKLVAPEHLLLGIPLETRSQAARILREAGATLPKLEAAMLGPAPGGGGGRAASREAARRDGHSSDADASAASGDFAGRYPQLARYTRDLHRLAAEGKLEVVIGRDDEIRRVIQILGRRTKNNPMVVGDPGVGKTAVVEGLAHRIARGDAPVWLRRKRLLALDIGSLVAGAKFRGEFEERVRSVLQEVQDGGGEVLLFIDEIHALVGAGKGEGSLDAASLLKPALARGELSCIGATTLDEFRLHIEKDPAFERRFQPVVVEEPNDEECLAMLRGIKRPYEERHRVRILDPAIVAAVSLSRRYVAGRCLPDKAIDLLDEAASRLRLELDSHPDEVDALERRSTSLRVELESLRRESDANSGQRRAAIDQELAALADRLGPLRAKWDAELGAITALRLAEGALETARSEAEAGERRGDLAAAAEARYGRVLPLEKAVAEAETKLREVQGAERLLEDAVEPVHVARVVADWTGIPVARMLEGERKKILGIEDNLRRRIIGQDEAVRLVGHAVKRARAGLQDGSRPIGSFLFLGPTGVGKTELARALAEFLFDDDNAMVRLDMSEYMEKHSVARLTGAPPGYIGFEEGGQLTEAVRRRPYAVVLFDEVEKAHPDAFNVLLALLDDGRLTDSRGRTVSFQNVVLIMTSNLGSSAILSVLDGAGGGGRTEAAAGTGAGRDKQAVDREVKAAVRAHFRPEFLNRIDEMVIFNPLGPKEIAAIVDLQMKRLSKLLGEQKLTIELLPEARDLLVAESHDPAFGARPVKRCIQRRLRDPLSEKILAGDLIPGDRIVVGRRGDELVFEARRSPEPAAARSP